MFFQRPGPLRGLIKPGMNVPVGTLANMFEHRVLTRQSHRWDIAAGSIPLRRFTSAPGNPKQVERGAHIHLLLDHCVEPGPRPLALQIGFFPTLIETGPEIW